MEDGGRRRELTPFTLSAVCTAASRNSHKISLVLPSNEPWSLIARVAVVGGRILFGSIDHLQAQISGVGFRPFCERLYIFNGILEKRTSITENPESLRKDENTPKKRFWR